jgi:hypothetical protein
LLFLSGIAGSIVLSFALEKRVATLFSFPLKVESASLDVSFFEQKKHILARTKENQPENQDIKDFRKKAKGEIEGEGEEHRFEDISE